MASVNTSEEYHAPTKLEIGWGFTTDYRAISPSFDPQECQENMLGTASAKWTQTLEIGC